MKNQITLQFPNILISDKETGKIHPVSIVLSTISAIVFVTLFPSMAPIWIASACGTDI